MIKLCFDDGNEYELIRIDASSYQVVSDKAHPNFTPINIVSDNNSRLLKAYTYAPIRFNGQNYGAKLINKNKDE